MFTVNDENSFLQLFGNLEETGASEHAPSSLKSRLYSKLIGEQQESGSLRDLDETRAMGHGLCVFEQLVQIAPVGKRAKSPFFCTTCHARILGEHFDNAPIFWGNCPYVQFKT
jgi:hypothetical protein